MIFNIEHPTILFFLVLVCSPTLIPLFRFFFDDWESFLEEIGYREGDDIWWKMIRIDMHSRTAFLRILLMLACFGILVGLTYTTSVRVFT
jgi:hypothetical protein